MKAEKEKWEFKIALNMVWMVIRNWKYLPQDLYITRHIINIRMRQEKYHEWMDDNKEVMVIA